jgi:hypothetical protein
LGEREAGCACALGGITGSVLVDMGDFRLEGRDRYVPKLEACIGWRYPVCRIGHIFSSHFGVEVSLISKDLSRVSFKDPETPTPKVPFPQDTHAIRPFKSVLR